MRTLLLIALLLPLSGLAQDQRVIAPWFVEVKGGVVYTDGDRAADDGSLLGFSLGKNLDAKWSLELEGFVDETDFDSGLQLEQKGLQINLVQVNRIPLWNPYFLVGIGAMHFKAGEQDDTDLAVTVSVGGKWDLNNNGLMLRADARYRYHLMDSEMPGLLESGEPVFTLGLQFPLNY